MLFAEELDDETIVTGGYVPIDVAEIVTVNVFAEVIELDTAATALGATFSRHGAGHDAAGSEIEAIEDAKKLWIEKIVDGSESS